MKQELKHSASDADRISTRRAAEIQQAIINQLPQLLTINTSLFQIEARQSPIDDFGPPVDGQVDTAIHFQKAIEIIQNAQSRTGGIIVDEYAALDLQHMYAGIRKNGMNYLVSVVKQGDKITVGLMQSNLGLGNDGPGMFQEILITAAIQ